jgi:hypothetical protein
MAVRDSVTITEQGRDCHVWAGPVQRDSHVGLSPEGGDPAVTPVSLGHRSPEDNASRAP